MSFPAIRAALALLAVAIPSHAAVTGSLIDADGHAPATCHVSGFAMESTQQQFARIRSDKGERPVLAQTECLPGGEFRIDLKGLPVFVIQVDAAGFAPIGAIVTPDSEVGTLLLTAASIRVGHVTAAGKPVAGAHVVFLSGSLDLLRTTDASGAFQVPDPTSWNMDRLVFHPDFASERLKRPVGQMPLDVRLSGGTMVRAHVMNHDGRTPAAHASISVDGWPFGETGDDGNVDLQHVPDGWKTLTATLGNESAAATRSGSRVLSLRLAPAASLYGRIVDATRKTPISGVSVSLFEAMSIFGGSIRSLAQTVTDAKGAYRFEDVAPGGYRVSAFHPDYVPASADATVTASEDVSHDLPVVYGSVVSGLVVDEERHPVAAAGVYFLDKGRNGSMVGGPSVWTDARGRFRSRALDTTSDLQPQAVRPGQPVAKGEVLHVSQGQRKGGVTLTIPHGTALRGVVTNDEGKPLAGVRILSAEDDDDSQSSWPQALLRWSTREASPQTGNDGTFSVRLAPGAYNFAFRLAGYALHSVRSVKVPREGEPLRVKLVRGATVEGRVQRAGTGAPISEAKVGIFEQASLVTTGSDGSFRLVDLEPGEATISVSRVEDAVRLTKVVTAPASNVVIEAPQGETISGRVTASDGGQPVTDFRTGPSTTQKMGSQLRQSPPLYRSFHNSDGSFAIENVLPGTMDLVVSAPGFVEKRVSGVVVEPGKGVGDLQIALDRGTRLTGTVTGPDDAPLGGVSIELIDPSNPATGMYWSNRNTTDMSGAYTIDQVEAGDKVLTFRKDGYPNERKNVRIEGREQTVDVRMSAGHTLQGRVTTADGSPAPDAQVSANSSGSQSYVQTKTDASGQYKLEGLASGRYSVAAGKSGYASAMRRDVDPMANGGTLDLVLQRGASIHGHISGLTAKELQNVSVVASAGNDYKEVTANPDGTYRVEGAPTGSVKVEAESNGQYWQTNGARSAPTRVIELGVGGDQEVNFDFAAGATVRGRITRTGQPVPGARVTFSAQGTDDGYSIAQADDAGMYEVKGLGTGTYRVTVAGNAESRTLFNGTFVSGSSQTYDIEIKASTIRGHVVDATNEKPLEGVVVSFDSLDDPGNRSSASGVSSSTGDFTVEGLFDGRFKALAQKGHYDTSSQEIVVSGGTADPIAFRMTSDEGFLVKAVDGRDGRELAIGVSIRDAQNVRVYERMNWNPVTDAARVALPAGHYRLLVSCWGYATRGSWIDVPAEDVTFPMTPGGTLIIRWNRGQPGTGTLVDPSGATHFITTGSADGHFTLDPGASTFENVEPGTYALRVVDGNGVVSTVAVVIREGATTNATP